MGTEPRLGYRGQQVLGYIEDVIARDGIAPTYRMIAEVLDMDSADVCKVVARLEQRGILKRRQVTRRQSVGWHKPVIVLLQSTPTT